MFGEAMDAFLKTLDQYTLEDVIPNAHRPQLLRILQIV
jgi:Rrf2 family nitric oxide-sensitive transcriptional repressor